MYTVLYVRMGVGVGCVYTRYTVYDNIGQHVDHGHFDRWEKLRSTDCDAILTQTQTHRRPGHVFCQNCQNATILLL